MNRLPRLLAPLLLSLAAVCFAGCTTDVPVGFGSGTVLASRDIVAEPARIVDAARLVLYELGDAVETSHVGERSELRTGRSRVVVSPRGSGTTRLEVYVAQYTGADHRDRADRLLQQIVERLD